MSVNVQFEGINMYLLNTITFMRSKCCVCAHACTDDRLSRTAMGCHNTLLSHDKSSRLRFDRFLAATNRVYIPKTYFVRRSMCGSGFQYKTKIRSIIRNK